MNLRVILSLVISFLLFIIIISVLHYKCNIDKNSKNIYADSIEQVQNKTKAVYESKIDSVEKLLLIKSNNDSIKSARILQLEGFIDNLTKKHNKTKLEVQKYNSDTGFVIAPNEYINECESCFDSINVYKKLNQQLKFERDSYDTLMRLQIGIEADRVKELEQEKSQWQQQYKNVINYKFDTTRKLKFSVVGMANNLFLPRAGGFGLIYEDKKFNEFGAHILFSSQGNIYIINAAKIISFKRKK